MLSPAVKSGFATFQYHLWIFCLAVNLIACTSNPDPPTPPVDPKNVTTFTVIKNTITGSFWGALEAVESPLEDLNLKRKAIPEPLLVVLHDPYALPSPMSCPTVIKEVVQLNGLLGADIGPIADTSLPVWCPNISRPSWENKDQYVQQGSSFAQSKAADIAREQISFIPYRSLMRKISGADAYKERLAIAYEAGKIRRGYLKGLGLMLHCTGETQDASVAPIIK